MSFGDESPPFTVTSNARCVGATEKALKVVVDGDEEKPMWVPKSVVHDDSEVWKVNDEGTLVVKEWWAEKNGL